MTEQSTETLFARMKLVLQSRNDDSAGPGECGRSVWLWHNREGWMAGIGVTLFGEQMDSEEMVRGLPTVERAIRALARAVLAGEADDP